MKFDEMPDEALLRFSDVSAICRRKRTKTYLDVKQGIFPAPVRIGRRSIAWRCGDIRAWLKSLGNQSASEE